MSESDEPLLSGVAVSVRAAPGQASPLDGPVDVAIGRGEVVAITGASGSGKTTLLRCLAKLEADAAGEVLFRGAAVADADVPAFRRRVVYVAQTPPRFPMTVEASLAAIFEFASARGEFDMERAAALARRVELSDAVMNRDLVDLSGGEAQRVGVIRALLVDPDVLLLDEPTSALDASSRAAVSACIAQWLGEAPRAAIVVSHDETTVSELATRRAVLAGTLDEVDL